MHKNIQKTSESNLKINNSDNNDLNANSILERNLPVLDIDKENRYANIISLNSKGLSQSEIAQQLGVDQSTVSRDLQFIKQEAKKKIEKYLNEDILFEYLRYMAGLNEVTRHLWEIVQSEQNAKDKTNALSLLMQCYNKRLEMLIGGPESYMNAKKSISEVKLHDRIENDPVLKMISEKNKFASSFPSPFSGLLKKKRLNL